MKKQIFKMVAVTAVIVCSLVWHSCQKDLDFGEKSEVSFNVLTKSAVLKSNSALKDLQVNTLSDADKIVITIQHFDGTPTDYTQYEMNIFLLGNDFITSKIALLTGDYKLTEFYVLNESGSVIFAAPLEGSVLAQNVDDPLPIEFSVNKNTIHKVNVDVISTENLEPEDFGLIHFQITEVETFQFLINVSEIGKDQLLTANLTITSGAYTYSQKLEAITNNIVTVRDEFTDYTLTIGTTMYQNYVATFTNAELKAYEKIPLIIELKPEKPEKLEIFSQFSTTGGTRSYLTGQSFTIGSNGGYLTRIITNAIGGVSGTQLTNGIANSMLKIREYVNDNETGVNHALTGNILATSTGTPTIIDYNYGIYYPNVEFVFDGNLHLDANTKYVIEIIDGSGVWVYCRVQDIYTGGQAYDIDGINLSHPRDIPFSLYLIPD